MLENHKLRCFPEWKFPCRRQPQCYRQEKCIKIPSVPLSGSGHLYLLTKLTISFSFFLLHLLRALMEIQPPPIKHPPSPTLSNSAAIMSSDSHSQHSSPAKKSRVHYHHHHQVTTIDERTSKVPLSVSSHHQLVAALSSPVSSTGPQPSMSGVSALQLQVQQRQNMMTQTTHTGHLALLYHSSQHHHHHVHPALPPIRRPSRLPPVVITRPPEIKA